MRQISPRPVLANDQEHVLGPGHPLFYCERSILQGAGHRPFFGRVRATNFGHERAMMFRKVEGVEKAHLRDYEIEHSQTSCWSSQELKPMLT
jgi:hypothetical protein